eukprot:CAMPEP_0170493430 /NCGR_PEP_ID=MMETSP0208-20121228/13889_1 /TAXON_ID=197538 /ORGANISM="Strombidium inclinatum, Strain S3" /LENGTH=168 /DNA_ID=CAMNT_0010769357 /DNA_START=14 /DNA_END=520 /DNA_ORIENTATION=+
MMQRFLTRARVQNQALLTIRMAGYSDAQHQAVLASWGKLKALDPTFKTQGCLIYEKIFELAPPAKDLFHFGNFKGDAYQKALEHFTPKTLKTIEKTLLNPTDDFNDKHLSNLGGEHTELGVISEHYKVVEDAIIITLQNVFKDEFTPELEEAWRLAYNVVANKMKVGA